MSKPVIAIVQPFTSSAMLAPALRAAGMSPVAVMDYEGPPLTPLRSSHNPEEYDAVINHFGDIEETIERLRGLKPMAVIPGVEAVLRLAQDCADELAPEYANVSELVDARRHKYTMHQALAKAGLPIIRQICTTDPEDVAAWIEREGLAGLDLVIKPTSSAGTIGVSLAPGGEGWRELFAESLGSHDKLGVYNEDVLVMERVTGTEYAVNTVSHDGRHSITDIVKYRRIPYGDGMAVYDSVEWLPYDPDGDRELIEYTLGALDAVGLRHWAAHTEVMMTAEGPRLLEINARLSGAGGPMVAEIATGESQVTRIVDICAGRGAELPDGYTLQRHAMIVFLLSHSTGTVRNAEIFDEAKALPSYHSPYHMVGTGDHVDASTDLFATMTMGCIILAHEDPEQLQADRLAIRELEKKLVIDPDA